MTSRFDHFKRFVDSGDQQAFASFYEWVKELSKGWVCPPRSHKPFMLEQNEREDVVQDVMDHLLTENRARHVLEKLRREQQVVDTVCSGAATDDDRTAAEAILGKYLKTMLATHGIRLFRKSKAAARMNDARLEAYLAPPPIGPERLPEIFTVVETALRRIEADTGGTIPRQSYEEMLRLAAGTVDMDTLTSETIATDDDLGALPADQARVRARDRVQQRHARTRTRLKNALDTLAREGTITSDEARDATAIVRTILMRRQNPAE